MGGIRKEGGDAFFHVMDITGSTSIEKLVTDTVEMTNM